MRVLFMAREYTASVGALHYMLEKGVDVCFAVIREKDGALMDLCRKNHIPVGDETSFWESEASKKEIDYLFSFYWKRIRGELLSRFNGKGRAINFHPGPLPEARGSGYHAAILENWGYWGVTAHYMDEEFDTGAIIRCDRFPTPEDIVNCDLVKLAHQNLLNLFKKVLDDLLCGKMLPHQEQGEGRYFSKEEVEEGKYVSSTDTDEMIKRKIRAYWNPPYAGASIVINHRRYTLIDDSILRYISEHTI